MLITELNKYGEKNNIEVKKEVPAEHKKYLKVRTENIANINQILNDLREFLNGNKSYIFEYHNGGKNLSGLCF